VKLLILQPFITNYRLPIFNELCDDYQVAIAASISSSYGQVDIDDFDGEVFYELPHKSYFKERILFQEGVLRTLFKVSPDVVFVSANPRYLSLWVLLLLCKLKNIKVILHGQGLYNKDSISYAHRCMFGLLNFLSDRYVCYTESCRKSLESLRIHSKAEVCENSIVNVNSIERTCTGEKGILFIGRLRNGCGIELLINAVEKINAKGENITLYVVGGGGLLDSLKEIYSGKSNICFTGAIYDAAVISELSKKCFVGCYPGDAGLSILHYMSMSLPPIAHMNMRAHMGPEPSYIIPGINGLLFERGDIESLVEAILFARSNSEQWAGMMECAYKTYVDLTVPSLGQRIKLIINDVLKRDV